MKDKAELQKLLSEGGNGESVAKSIFEDSQAKMQAEMNQFKKMIDSLQYKLESTDMKLHAQTQKTDELESIKRELEENLKLAGGSDSN
jgi:formate-dependent nitrite reductase cytochrome c552 subunit